MMVNINVSNMTNSWILRLFIAEIAIIIAISAMSTATSCEDSQRLQGPVIHPCKSEVILQKGQNFTLTCKSKRSEVEFRQQEIPEEMTTLNLMQKNETVEEDEYMYKTVLELYNVDQYNIGYYACFDTTLRTNVNDILNNLTTEPNNTEHISFIYIYVNGTGNLFAPMREVVTSRNNYQVVIECRPTTPDVEVTLQTASNKTPDAIRYSPKIGFLLRACSRDAFKCEGRRGNDTAMKRIRNVTPPPVPKIYGGFNYFLAGETFSLNCTVAYRPSYIVNLYWEYPRKLVMQDSIKNISNEYELNGTTLYRNITIVNASKENNGTYICVSKNNCGHKEDTFTKVYLDKAFLNLSKNNDRHVIETIQKRIKLDAWMDAYPPATFYFLRDNKSLPTQPSKYSTLWYNNTSYAILQISNLTVTDTANYTLVATNGHLTKQITFDLRVEGAPVVDFRPGDKKYMLNTEITLMCKVIGYPLPQVDWIFSNDEGGKPETLSSTSTTVTSVYEATAYITIPVSASGNITCKASNKRNITSVTRRLLVYEIEDGFGVKNREKMWFLQNQNVTVTCIASKYDFASVTWIGRDDEYLNSTVEYTRNPFSLVAQLRMPRISLNQSGEYTCRGLRLDGNEDDEPVNITVAALLPPRITDEFADMTEEVYPLQKVQLACQAEGVPLPEVKWFKDDVLMNNNSNVEIVTRIINRTVINSTLLIKEMDDDYKGTYKCLAKSDKGEANKFYVVTFKVDPTYATYLSIIIVIIFILIVIVIYLTLKVRKEKQFRRELAAAGLLYFKEGVPKSINPDLGIDEQAELLPYDEKFEFPREKLILGKQLGAGAFGVVYKAQARGIINAEETTEVAVKMVKKTADNMYIKALASELKIMVHLGQHVNIVNLLGACTKDVGKRELSVIVEYCKFGNIHNYMQKHREVFIDQLTDNKEKNLGKVNRGFSCSTGSSGVQSDYFGTSNTQETDHTFINTGNSNRSTRKAGPEIFAGKPTQVVLVRVSGGYAQPLWRSNYVTDYSFDGRNPRPLTSRDLLAWAFQIARGMEYLASRKVLHGDLAARNVLLADDNVVKICDFGLARSIYKNDEYHKTENSLLPVKWLAIECMTDRIFSTQSDVWSYGIVLWELFSLAKTPYPNISPSDLLRWLAEGKRMSKPPYADDRLYDVMLKCWDYQPAMRPSFTQLQQIMGSFLEDNVRTHLVDLNETCVNKNAQEAGHEDYLIKMSAPDYNNLVTPSPHHYVNETKTFFPVTPTQVDDEGYLQRKVFSLRPENNKFNFDGRNFNTPGSEASSCGSESTPMLTLNNLTARSGSESDQENTASPYITICTTIDEETDEVFEPKHNDANNAIINTAVTNPTYITLDADIETKPKDINRSYINVPNNLVK